MKKLLLACLFLLNLVLNAQITLGAGNTTVGTAPVSTYYGYSYVQQIFTKNEINANAAGNITGLKFYLNPSSVIANSSNWVIYLGTTSKTGFTSSSDWIPVSQLTQVFSGTVTNVNGVVTVVLPVPFAYNNLNNLIVAAEENAPGYDENGFANAFYNFGSAANSLLYYQSDNTNPNPLFPPNGVRDDQKSVITFNGLTANATIACPNVIYPVNNTSFVPLSPTIEWNAVSGATGYKVSLGTVPGGTDIINQQLVSTSSLLVPQTLTANTVYYLKVTALNAVGESQGCSNIMFRTAPGQPVNDECVNAITLTVNPNAVCASSVQGYTLGATGSGLVASPCYGNPDDDVWFKFVATAATHKISLTDIASVGTTFSEDLYFQVFSGSCGNLTSILCSDPASSLVSGLTVGATYYLRVYSYNGAGSNQSFTICVGSIPPPPANDACTGAISATNFPYSYTQLDASGATNNSGFLTTCTDGMNDGTWFSFVGNGGNFDIIVTMPSGSSFDPQVGVFTGSCGSLACVETEDDGGDGESEILTIPTISGTTYYVNVGHYDSSDNEMEDIFSINILTNTLGTESTVSTIRSKVKIYPNPFTDVLNISSVENIESATITDMSGKLIKTIENPTSLIHLQDLRSGVYILSLWMKDHKRQTIKIIKK
ncbi:T9SS type A sorting domain-containing protein [Chryseobacterium chendengshani]|uniref:T9SS type A sorting domain-containing protein n=1 Tax=Chryseobacterium sp. LJ668 TaxID=2864040 RepID=UPI001C68C733|nr:T9SS type A sorting domain-containing protein [Chryseobacterium sp. LJ668]MBW8523395.1 T9SS type A sorting domain-containing protein [Chryseobacterium sp. LJ668]QYK15683.1 T9SS type A sorting domain-containing protein [Chryseobacterium sp. LJ668]